MRIEPSRAPFGASHSLNATLRSAARSCLALHRYRLLVVTPARLLAAYTASGLDPAENIVTAISADTLAAIETARPGYGPMAGRYLASGHLGFAAWSESRLAALAWLYRNGSQESQRVSYYPLDAGRIWFHAAWTHPAFRGRGLHKRLLQAQAQYVQATHGEAIIEANIAVGNTISMHNYLVCGFADCGSLIVLRIGRNRFAWKRLSDLAFCC